MAIWLDISTVLIWYAIVKLSMQEEDSSYTICSVQWTAFIVLM